MGYEPSMLGELEFYIVDAKTGKPIDQAGYCSLPPDDLAYDFRHELGKACEYTKMNVRRIHHEVKYLQYEFCIYFKNYLIKMKKETIYPNIFFYYL